MRFIIITIMTMLLINCSNSEVSTENIIINTYWSLRRYCNWDIYAKPVVRCDLANYIEELDPEFFKSATSNADVSVLDEHAFFAAYAEYYNIDSRVYLSAYHNLIQVEIENDNGNFDCGLISWFFGNLAGEIGDDVLIALLGDYYNHEFDSTEDYVYLWTIEAALEYDQINGIYMLADYLAGLHLHRSSWKKLYGILGRLHYRNLRGVGGEAENCLDYFSQTLIDIYNETDIYSTELKFLCTGYLGHFGTKENIDYLFLIASDIDNSQIERIYGLSGLLRYLEHFSSGNGIYDPFIYGINKETFLLENLNMPILMGDRYEIDYLNRLIKHLDEPANINATLEYTVNSISHIQNRPQSLYEFIMENIDIIRQYDYAERFRIEINLTNENWERRTYGEDSTYLEEVLNLLGEG